MIKCNKSNQEDCPNFNPDLNAYQRCGNQIMGDCYAEKSVSKKEGGDEIPPDLKDPIGLFLNLVKKKEDSPNINDAFWDEETYTFKVWDGKNWINLGGLTA